MQAIYENAPVAPATPVEPVCPLLPDAPVKPEAPVLPLEPVDPVLPASMSGHVALWKQGFLVSWMAHDASEFSNRAQRQFLRVHLCYPPRQWSLSGRCHLSLLWRPSSLKCRCFR